MMAMAAKYGDKYNSDEEDEETRWRNKIKIKPEYEWDYPPWNPEMKDRFGPVPEKETEGKGCYDRNIGRRRNEREPGEFMKGDLVDEKEEEDNINLEYYNFRIKPQPPVDEYLEYRWAKVDCDIEDALAEEMQVNQWPTFWYIKGSDAFEEKDKDKPMWEREIKKIEMHGYERE
jgi:hypothetical protein